ncbi:protein transport protein Sec16B isoform X2 [Electrophorus electricus]|uniref:protein transport protein Sec16B isoform X2 n=1 Tax=Electrophorus electricus TaxID=8005 RepID=UPI0015CFBF53|nr:protein transport protein Sec16B isoform X2 [Electrophorus electricus]
MKSRGQSWYGPRSRNHTSGQPPQPRDDPYRLHYPPPDPREMARQWHYPDPWYSQYSVSPPPSSELIPPSSSLQSTQSYGPNWTRPHSRQARDYSPQSYWDYRDDYGYYDHGYYQGHYGCSDASGWPRHGVWQAEGYQSRELKQGWQGTTPTDQYGLRRGSVQPDVSMPGMEHRPRVENEDGGRALEVWDSGALTRSKTSGLSSSSYELSQYINGSEQTDTVPSSHSEAEPKAPAPLKFCLPHVAVSFGPAGQLVRVRLARASQGEPAQVELHNLEVILSGTCEQNDMRDFPGPLSREDLHKVDVINFALQMADACLKDQTATDASSAALLWQLLVLHCRQNGRIVGSDIAELLMQGSQSFIDEKDKNKQSLIDLSETPTPETDSLNAADLLTGSRRTTEEVSAQDLQKYTKFLLEGRKKEALELAMQGGLWGHALFLASKMDSRTYPGVLSRFTGSLAPSDPLQTLFQLLSGRIPVVATSYSREKWGDWRPHLAVVLSNGTGDSDVSCRFLVTMGDTLASRGFLHAAHICYVLAGSSFGWYSTQAHRLVLLGSAQTASFTEFCHNSAIRCTEVLEYCRRLEDASYSIPSFQVYKFLYACRLLDCGLFTQAFHYCEGVAKALLRIPEPHMTLLKEVTKLADRLKHSETQFREAGSAGTDPDPDWLVLLQRRLQALQMGDCSSTYPSAGDCAWNSEKNWEHADKLQDLNPDILLTDQTHTSPQTSQNGADVGQDEKTESVAQTCPPEQRSLPFCPPEEQCYTSAVQRTAPDGQLPQTYAPVPIYPLQTVLATPPGQPQDVGFSTGANMMDTSEDGSALGSVGLDTTNPPEVEAKVTNLPKSEKAPKSGWFSGWFGSKPKEPTQDHSKQDESADSGQQSPVSAGFPCPHTSMLPSQPKAAGINPFSRRAGQSPGVTMGQNFGSMSNEA